MILIHVIVLIRYDVIGEAGGSTSRGSTRQVIETYNIISCQLMFHAYVSIVIS